MLIIGELINCTRKKAGEAAAKRDAEFFRGLARKQVDAGARVLDVNGDLPGDEGELLAWLVDVVQGVVDVPLCLDSANPKALQALARRSVDALSKDGEIGGLAKYGTAEVVPSQNMVGGLPTRNWQSGEMGASRATSISGERLYDELLRGAAEGKQYQRGREIDLPGSTNETPLTDDRESDRHGHAKPWPTAPRAPGETPSFEPSGYCRSA